MSEPMGAEAVAPPAKVFLAVPHYGTIEPEALPGIMLASERCDVTVRLNGASLLAHNFSRLFVDALRERETNGHTHFAMMHSDQQAPPGWLDVMLAEMERVGADVISAILSIKDHRGLTSTGERDPQTGAIRRYTLREIHGGMPETFCAADVAPGKELMINTGLWVAKLGPWADEFPGFSITDRIITDAQGRKRAAVMPEDWAYSIWCHQRGLRVFATRKVKVIHWGRWGFSNDEAIGTWETDTGDSY